MKTTQVSVELQEQTPFVDVLLQIIPEYVIGKYSNVIDNSFKILFDFANFIKMHANLTVDLFCFIYMDSLIQLKKFKEFTKFTKSIHDIESLAHHEIVIVYQARNFLENRDEASALALIAKLEHSDSSKLLFAEIRYLTSELYFIRGQYQDAIELIEESIISYKSRGYLRSVARLKQTQAKFHRLGGEYEKSIEKLASAKSIYLDLEDQYGVARCDLFIGISYFTAREDVKAESYIKSAHEYFFTNMYKYPLYTSSTALCTVYKNIGKYELAKKYGEIGLAHVEDSGTLLEASLLNSVGLVYKHLNQLDSAEEYIRKSYDIVWELGFERRISDQANNLATIYISKGEMVKALKYIEESYELSKKEENERILLDSYSNLVRIHLNMANYSKARHYFVKGLNLAEKLESKNEMVLYLILEMELLQLTEENPDIQPIIDRLDVLTEKINAPVIRLTYLVEKAKYLAQSQSTKERNQALEIFRNVFRDSKVDNLVLVKTLSSYCQLLIDKLKLADDNTLFEELNLHLTKLREVSKTTKSTLFEIQLLLLLGEIDLLQFHVESAKNRFLTALNLAEKSQLLTYSKKIQASLSQIQESTTKWSFLSESNANMEQRFLLSSIEDLLQSLNTEYKSILHPVRFAIMRLLYYFHSLKRTELLKKLGLSSSSLEPHLDKLTTQNYITSSYQLIEQKPQKVIEITPEGISQFTNFREAI